ncbi:MAG: DUF4159 domain-containing protein [Rhodobacter sp.]|uniref:DUF4159 domain-containing protein n=1 Tax=Pararhodobacter sp. TaxID=2127056 RepID=UPI001D63983A|nr:DUF4159 domain-containing protein [Pararhodobacter sp.]MCB1346697.1 DUF4159 domain-containing protein [Paracoccaceae bacterium]MCC0072948.1 DUF4159 domain-containing protein [Rhodobacter sp.]HPD93531.1 DUF4159 domain-containing protein [Pararhodobacter sp.]
MSLSALGFAAPWVLWSLLALPILWWLLRAVPPAPVRRRFPGVALLLGLRDRDPESQRTPWWLLLLRVLTLAALILALAGPVLNPARGVPGQGPLLVVMDASWASARDWPRRIDRVGQALEAAQRAGRTVSVVSWTDAPEGAPEFRAADHWRERLTGLAPRPWAPAAGAVPDWIAGLPAGTETLWVSDGLARDGRAALLAALAQVGPVSVFEPASPVLALAPAVFDGQIVSVTARRTPGPAQALVLDAVGRDPAGAERVLDHAALTFAAGAVSAEVRFDLPPELRNRVTRFQIDGARGAGAVTLTDDGLQRRKVALLSVREGSERLALLSPLHYLREALRPNADVIESASLDDLLLAGPDVLVLADMPGLTDTESQALLHWVEQGGLLLRFAGPRMAGAGASAALGGALSQTDDPLLPVRLRAGGRTVGGAMSWGDPRSLAPFPETSPFVGLPVPADVGIRAQVLAQPGPDLAAHTIAALADGTPLVTRAARGAGQVVLFHVTANAEWSNLPLSGLFVQMLDRLAISTRGARPEAGDMAGTHWQPQEIMDGFGLLSRADDRAAVTGEALAPVLLGDRPPGPDLPPGLYAGTALRIAVNATDAQTPLTPAQWPLGTQVETGTRPAEVPLAGFLFALAAVVLALDALATLALGGRLLRAAMLVLALGLAAAPRAQAQTGDVDPRILQATENVVLAAVASGDAQVDEVALAGLRGVSDALYARSSVEPGAPMRVDIETDELSVFPFLYWPVIADSPLPSPQAYAKLNRYLRTGGMILFDTRDAEQARLTGGTTAAGRRLQQIAAGLDIPPLEPVPADHVLTRTFYLLSDFPGRYQGGTVWVEAAPADAQQAEGMPFRNLNDGVSPVVVGSNDWASAWAVDAQGLPMAPVGRGTTGDRQREMAMRFGVNLIMYVLSGNYKSDQVHVPALLERLGQ